MRINPDTKIVVGPPGTGKTRTLIRMVSEAIQDSCPPDYICYLSFTRQAAKEARDRILAAYPEVDKDKFMGFRTLHSLCYWLLGIRPKEVISRPPALGNRLLDVLSQYDYLYSYHRMSGKSLEWVWDKKAKHIVGNRIDFLRWVEEYRAFKKETKKIDFIDMVDIFVERQIAFPFTYLFVDEAQDLTPQQWVAIKQISKHVQHVTVAGDVDQTIFSWAGADSNILEELEGERIYLTQSYRVPDKAHQMAEVVLGEMGREIIYSPAKVKGEVHWIRADEIPRLPLMNGESWYILGRNQCFIDQIEGVLQHHRLPYSRLGASGKERTQFESLSHYIKAYEKGLTTGHIHARTEKIISERLCSDAAACLEACKPWYEAFDKLPVTQTRYMIEALAKAPFTNIGVGTFHSSKGGEADNVILLGDATMVCLRNMAKGKIEEFRALYVAITRTKNRLFICSPTRKAGLPWTYITLRSRESIKGLLSNEPT